MSDIFKCFWSYLDRGRDWSWGGPKEDKTVWKSFFKKNWWTTFQFKTEQLIEKLLIQTSNHNWMIYQELEGGFITVFLLRKSEWSYQTTKIKFSLTSVKMIIQMHIHRTMLKTGIKYIRSHLMWSSKDSLNLIIIIKR